MNTGEEQCKEITFKKCSYEKTREKESNCNCKRNKCCTYYQKGDFIKTLSCSYENEECLEVVYEKIIMVATRDSCYRKKKSCTLGKSGDKIREISCRFIGEEECVEKNSYKMSYEKNKRKL